MNYINRFFSHKFNISLKGKELLFASLLLEFVALGFLSYWLYSELDQVPLTEDALHFLDAIKSLDISGTHVSTRTGVSVYWMLSGIQVLINLFHISQVMRFRRIALFIIRLCLIPIMYWVIKRLFDVRTALVVVLYIVVNTMIFMGFETTWLDKFVTLFGFIAILAWALYVKTDSMKNGIISGMFWGLALLTKPVAFLFIPMMFLMFADKIKDVDYWKKFILILVIGIMTFTVVYPAMWVDPIHVMFSRYGNSSGTLQLSLGGDGANIWFFYPKQILLTDAVLAMGVLLFLYESLLALKKRIVPSLAWRFALAGIIYLLIVMTISLLLRDEDTGPGALFSIRYLTPPIPLFTLYFMNRVVESKPWIRNIMLFTIFFLALLKVALIRRFVWVMNYLYLH